MKRQQRIMHGLGGEFPHFKFAVEFHLALGGMDVHVHGGGINFEKQTADRIAAFHQRVVIALDERIIDAAIFHRPAVHKNKLAVARRARDARRTDQSPDSDLRISDLRISGFSGRAVSKISVSSSGAGFHPRRARRKNSPAGVFHRRAARGGVRARLRCGWKWPRRI